MSSDLSGRGLRLTYPGHDRAAVGGVDLEVPAGGYVALLAAPPVGPAAARWRGLADPAAQVASAR